MIGSWSGPRWSAGTGLQHSPVDMASHTHKNTHNRPKHMSMESLSLQYKYTHTNTTGTSPHLNLSPFDSFQQWSTHSHIHTYTEHTRTTH